MNTQCPKCGAENRADGRFCRQCGTPLRDTPPTATCQACGAALKAGARFCHRCGAPLTESTAAPPTPTPPAMPPTPQAPMGLAMPIQPRAGTHHSGQIAVGNYNLLIQMGDVRDAVVNIVAPAAQPRPRATPASLRPRAAPYFLDRQVEVAAATATVLSAGTVAINGESGMGKTTLLCYLAHHPAANAFRDGIIYLYAAHQNAEDIAAFLYDALHTCDVPFHPTPAQIREGLQDRRALILLDDIALGREDLDALLHLAPSCAFVISSETQRYWGTGQVMELPGLPPSDGAVLLERESGHTFSPEERSAAQRLSTAMKGHPLQLLQLAALARSSQRPIGELLPLVQTPAPERGLTARSLAALSELEQRVLAALAAVKTPLHAEPLALIVGQTDLQAPLQRLQQQGLVQQHSPRYSLTGNLAEQLALIWDLEPWRKRALEALTAWAEGQQTSPETLHADSDAILSSVEQALAAQQPREALRLIRASESVLASTGRWGAWGQLLQHALEAARALQDRSTEAWALHQLGTRAGCLGEGGAATLLTQALNLRQASGDKAGAALTRHNMSIFLGAPPAGEMPKEEPTDLKHPQPKPPPPPTARPNAGLSRFSFLAAAAISIVVIALGGWQVWLYNRDRVTAAVPPLTPRLWLAGGCDRPYSADTTGTLYLESNLDGVGYLSLDGAAFAELGLRSGVPEAIDVAFAKIAPGAHSFEVTVVEGQRLRKAGARCAFTVTPVEIITTEPPPDTEGPPAPQLYAPKDEERRYCPIGAAELPIEFTWSEVSDASGIAIYELTLEALEYQPRQYPPARSERPSLKEALPCPEIYRWRVRAFDGAGNAGAWSTEQQFSLRPEEDVTPPPVPDTISPGDPFPEYAESVMCPATLRWNSVSDPSGVFYAVEVEAIYDSGNALVLSRRDLNSTELVLDDAKTCYPYENYRWRVSARDGAGNESGEWSPWRYYDALP